MLYLTGMLRKSMEIGGGTADGDYRRVLGRIHRQLWQFLLFLFTTTYNHINTIFHSRTIA